MSAHTLQIILGAVNLYAAFLTSLLMLPMLLGKVSMNSGYGTKVPGAFDSEEKWHQINKYSAKAILWIYCLPIALSGLTLLLLPQVPPLLFPGVFLVHGIIFIPLKLAMRYSNSIKT